MVPNLKDGWSSGLLAAWVVMFISSGSIVHAANKIHWVEKWHGTDTWTSAKHWRTFPSGGGPTPRLLSGPLTLDSWGLPSGGPIVSVYDAPEHFMPMMFDLLVMDDQMNTIVHRGVPELVYIRDSFQVDHAADPADGIIFHILEDIVRTSDGFERSLESPIAFPMSLISSNQTPIPGVRNYVFAGSLPAGAAHWLVTDPAAGIGSAESFSNDLPIDFEVSITIPEPGFAGALAAVGIAGSLRRPRGRDRGSNRPTSGDESPGLPASGGGCIFHRTGVMMLAVGLAALGLFSGDAMAGLKKKHWTETVHSADGYWTTSQYWATSKVRASGPVDSFTLPAGPIIDLYDTQESLSEIMYMQKTTDGMMNPLVMRGTEQLQRVRTVWDLSHRNNFASGVVFHLLEQEIHSVDGYMDTLTSPLTIPLTLVSMTPTGGGGGGGGGGGAGLVNPEFDLVYTGVVPAGMMNRLVIDPAVGITTPTLFTNDQPFDFEFIITVPEPGMAALIAGFCAAAGLRRRRR